MLLIHEFRRLSDRQRAINHCHRLLNTALEAALDDGALRGGADGEAVHGEDEVGMVEGAHSASSAFGDAALVDGVSDHEDS